MLSPRLPLENPRPAKRPRATLEEVEDEDDRWVQDFPEELKAGAVIDKCNSQFEKMKTEWEMARWLMTSGLSQGKIDQYLKLKSVWPQWYCHPFELTGDECDAEGVKKTEVVELWHRDPVECVRELLGNPSFKKQGYVPRRIFKKMSEDGEGTNREYNEMWTADWWWEVQKLLPPGSTLCPIIIASDKTQLTRFSGDQQAWPTAGTDGVPMDCADGFVRRMYLILAAYIADYPEQCLVACCRENACPRCLVTPKRRGEFLDSPWRNRAETLRILSSEAAGRFFSDHIVSWRFRAMTPHPTLRHFKKGISLTSQWTGNEHKNMEKVFLGVLANTVDPAVQRAVKAVLDFAYYAHFETHCDESLAQMDAAWASFHANKHVFEDLEIRKKFDINKLHKLKHYTESIRTRGTADGYNTENMERLHIDLAKVGYKATNRKAYIRQMTVWLQRQESVHRFGSYLQWAVPGYVARAAANDDPDDEDDDHPDSDDEADESPASISPYSIAKKTALPQSQYFLHKLDEFLQSKSLASDVEPSEASTFPVFKHISLTLPAVSEVSSRAVQDKIRAVRGEPVKMTAKGVKLAKGAQFDTVLVRTHARLDGESPMSGLRVARVRLIFRLPEKYGSHPDPLAYPDTGMYLVSLSSRNLRQNSGIIAVTDIVRSCHLTPVFGRSVDPTWTSENVLDTCKSFYFNPYLRHHDFYLFRYLVDLHTSRREAEQRRVRMRQLGRAGRG
ncbi:hypothetical protein B0H14DRAFT_3081378 [Mycena olivaceomarginata]|nr:hypothetical protein B0H14DRAFT_3081378 [Mycena olivaceomarginata]